MSSLRSQSLRKKYKSRTVVQDVSLDVTSGEVVGLLGPNGAGKTTCFYMIVGLIPVDAGAIHLDSVELTHLPIHRRARLGISYLPQENSVFRRLTVEENIQAILELQGLPAADIEPRLAELLKDLNITHLRKHTAISLSGGERRRLGVPPPPRASTPPSRGGGASGGGSRSPARSAPPRRSSCSTSPSPASIRSPCST